ncbi:MAG TPA: DUF397 domain-containing protein [Pseudonocardiaceae bacterium]|nr:DUF397 domain-containing protein [Pseudonocardiaceae bacterium]
MQCWPPGSVCWKGPPDVTDEWRKSSRSANADSCVEVHRNRTALRDSKNAAGPALSADVALLIGEVKAGRLAR